MPMLFWDASALVKRYVEETGSATVHALFDATNGEDTASTVWGYAETYSILLRRRNAGLVRSASFDEAVSALRRETVLDPRVTLVSLPDALVFAGIALMQRHNINTADAVILAGFLEVARALMKGGQPCALIAADKRLVRAAQAEGLTAVNPELLPVWDVPSSLASL